MIPSSNSRTLTLSWKVAFIISPEYPSGSDVIIITLLIFVSVAGPGLAVSLLWKLLNSKYDQRELVRFQTELEQRHENRVSPNKSICQWLSVRE